MGDFLIGLLMPLGVLILLILLIIALIKLFKKKSSPNIQQQNSPSNHGTSSNTGTVNSHSGHATPTKSRAKKIWTIILSILVIGIILYVIVIIVINYLVNNQFDNRLNNDPPKGKKELSDTLPQKSLPDSIIMRQDTIIEYYHLSKGSEKVIYTRPDYDYTRYSGGWKYYCQPQNETYFIIYGGEPPRVDDTGIKYFIVKFYEVECNIKIVFVPKKE